MSSSSDPESANNYAKDDDYSTDNNDNCVDEGFSSPASPTSPNTNIYKKSRVSPVLKNIAKFSVSAAIKKSSIGSYESSSDPSTAAVSTSLDRFDTTTTAPSNPAPAPAPSSTAATAQATFNQYVIPSAAAAIAAHRQFAQGYLTRENTLNPSTRGSNVIVHPSASNTNGGQGTNHGRVVLHLAKSKYRLLRRIAKLSRMNTIEIDEGLEGKEDFNVLWGDTVIPLDRLKKFQPWQHFNHFASMYNITRKHNLSITMGKMQRGLSEHFTFSPRAWSLKIDRPQFEEHFKSLPDVPEEERQVFIMKPNSGCQGKGIVLTRDPLKEVANPEDYVVQEYVSRPLLIDGRKFDLRVYCLVTSMKYPSIFVFNEGLVRLCAEAYEKPNAENMANVCKHLTNFAVNKKSEAYQAATSQGDVGSKRNFQWFNKWLDEVLTDEMLGIRSSNNNAGNERGSRSARLWADIDHIIVKTVLSAQPKVRHSYNMLFPSSKNDGYTCFEVLGFDILIDHKLQPWLMEVNHTPSFVTGTTMDLQVKGALIREVLSVVNPTGRDKQRWKVRQINQRNQRALLGENENEKSVDDDSDDGDDVRISPVRSPTTAAEVAEALEIGFGGEFALNNENLTNNGLPNLQKIPINTNEYRQAHEKLEDHRIVNFRRVYPVPEDAAIIRATRELSERHSEQYHSLIRECEIAEGSTHQSRTNGSSKTIPVLTSGNNPYAHKIIAAAASLRPKTPKENHITTPGEVSDINHRIAATLSQSELDMRRNIYGEVIEYASIHNAAKKDPNRLRRTSAANGTSSTGADATGEANKENACVANDDQHQQVTSNTLPLKMVGKNNQGL